MATDASLGKREGAASGVLSQVQEGPRKEIIIENNREILRNNINYKEIKKQRMWSPRHHILGMSSRHKGNQGQQNKTI